MAAAKVTSSTSAAATGRDIRVPKNDIARLMYYLHCMSRCLDDAVPANLCNFNNYYKLSEDEMKAVVALAVILSPDVLLNKVIFMLEDNSPALKGTSNEFYEINQTDHILAATRGPRDGILVLQGKRVTIHKIMVFDEKWLKDCYLTPLVKSGKNVLKS